MGHNKDLVSDGESGPQAAAVEAMKRDGELSGLRPHIPVQRHT